MKKDDKDKPDIIGEASTFAKVIAIAGLLICDFFAISLMIGIAGLFVEAANLSFDLTTWWLGLRTHWKFMTVGLSLFALLIIVFVDVYVYPQWLVFLDVNVREMKKRYRAGMEKHEQQGMTPDAAVKLIFDKLTEYARQAQQLSTVVQPVAPKPAVVLPIPKPLDPPPIDLDQALQEAKTKESEKTET